MAHLHISSLSSHTVTASSSSSSSSSMCSMSPLSLLDKLHSSSCDWDSLCSSLCQLPSSLFRGTASPSDSLVVFRCFVQDMYDPEFYAKTYDLVDEMSGTRTSHTGLFRDALEMAQDNLVVDESSIVNGQKFSFKVTAIPAINEWVHHHYYADNDCFSSMDDVQSSGFYDQSKRARKELTRRSHFDTTKKLAALLRVYDSQVAEQIKLNDVIEISAIVEQCNGHDDDDDDENQESKNLPVLHLVKMTKLRHSNPLIHLWPTIQSTTMSEYRTHLHYVLTNLCLGDSLAADFLLMHLLSHVYSRQTALVIGKWSLNLHNIPNLSNYTQRLTHVLSLITERLLYMPLSVESLNKDAFIPRKDYEKNALSTGLLQLAANTHLVLDETRMKDGQLNEKGVKNLAALGNLIRWQKVSYDFQFSHIEFDTDIPCLVLSEGRSLLTCDTDLRLHASNTTVDASFIDTKLKEAESCMTEAKAFVNFVRCFLTLAKDSDFVVDENIQGMIETDFVEERQRNAQMRPDDLHNLLVLARLLALSQGKQKLDEDVWCRAKDMEKERRERNSALPSKPTYHF